jgi:predicted DCC family thiol-disulfide oxidoreductase YuxK
MNEGRPLLVYDGECGFCRLWIERWKFYTRETVDYAPFQEAANRFPEIPPEKFQRSVQLIEHGGRVSSGAEAVFRTLAYANQKWFLRAYRSLPGFRAVSEWFYRLVARNRDTFLKITRFLWGKHVRPSTYFLAQFAFLRFLAVIFFIAFLSLWVQVLGLIGQNGILPATPFLNYVKERAGTAGYFYVPTLCWFGSSDAFLQFLCAGGAALSVLLFLGITTPLTLFLLWLFYLSLASVSRDFLAFQWDVLLLETSFPAIFLTPLRFRHRINTAPSRSVLFLLRWLLFRLMFSSAAVKLLSGDPAWRNLTALNFHYETQPLPTWIGWYAHQLPEWFQKFSTVSMFVVEGLVPFFVFAPRRIRTFAFWVLASFQLVIFLTGNYCFFNLLTIALCLLLLDDETWPNRKFRRFLHPVDQSSRKLWLSPIVILLFLFSVVQFGDTLRAGISWPDFVRKADAAIGPFRSINGYGLFAVMTTTRPEIVVEGSSDGERWLPYEFKYKPGDLKRRPEFVEPHQPRLDWQMWFAALETYQSNQWFIPFSVRLLEGNREVLSLLRKNPFPSAPPRYIRASLYAYRFVDRVTKHKEGVWWKREYKGLYCPPLSLHEKE